MSVASSIALSTKNLPIEASPLSIPKSNSVTLPLPSQMASKSATNETIFKRRLCGVEASRGSRAAVDSCAKTSNILGEELEDWVVPKGLADSICKLQGLSNNTFLFICQF
jgi:hypothetical protein